MKNIQPYIIAGMTIIIVVLCWFLYSANSSVDIYKKQIELSKLNEEKIIVIEAIGSELNDLSKLSSDNVKKSDSIIKKIKHETPKINDTTDSYMLQYIRHYRPN